MGKTVPLVDHIQPKAAVPGDRPQEDVASPAVDVVDPLIEHDDAGEMSAIDDVYFGQGFLVDFFETVGDVFTGKLVAGPEAMAEQNGVLFEEVFVYVNDFEGGTGRSRRRARLLATYSLTRARVPWTGLFLNFTIYWRPSLKRISCGRELPLGIPRICLTGRIVMIKPSF